MFTERATRSDPKGEIADGGSDEKFAETGIYVRTNSARFCPSNWS
jgi:hypothetical protein